MIVPLLSQGLVALVQPISKYLISGSIGMVIGLGIASYYYDLKMDKITKEYVISIEQARSKEKEWMQVANEIENTYKDKLTAVNRDNTELVNGLRKQLSEYSQRVSSTSTTSSKSDDSARRTEVAERLGDLVEFSSKCSKRVDQLIIQVNSLQEFIKNERK